MAVPPSTLEQMPDVTPVSPELSRRLSALARALVAAARTWMLYPPAHPAVRAAVAHFTRTLDDACEGEPLALGITPDTLLVHDLTLKSEGPLVAGVMDDNQVAQLLATTLAMQGQASARLAAVFGTIAPDDQRRPRVGVVRLETGEVGVVTREHPAVRIDPLLHL